MMTMTVPMTMTTTVMTTMTIEHIFCKFIKFHTFLKSQVKTNFNDDDNNENL